MSDHGARALVVAAAVLIAGGALLWWLSGRPSHVDHLVAAAASAAPGDLVVVADVVAPADAGWTQLHVFAPYTPPHLVEAEVGRRVGEARGLVHDEVMLLVLTGEGGRVVAAGLAGRAPVDWLPLATDSPYPAGEAVFEVVLGDGGPELRRTDR